MKNILAILIALAQILIPASIQAQTVETRIGNLVVTGTSIFATPSVFTGMTTGAVPVIGLSAVGQLGSDWANFNYTTAGGLKIGTTLTISGVTARNIQMTSSAASSTDIALNNTSAGGKEWVLLSGGSTASLAPAGSYILYNNSDGKLAYTVAPATGNVSFAALAVSKSYAIASLPTGVTGAIATITDQAAACPAKGVAPTAGGAIICPVFYNGAAWVGT